MKPIRLVLIAMLSLLAFNSFAQGDGIVGRAMRKDTSLLLIKRSQVLGS